MSLDDDWGGFAISLPSSLNLRLAPRSVRYDIRDLRFYEVNRDLERTGLGQVDGKAYLDKESGGPFSVATILL